MKKVIILTIILACILLCFKTWFSASLLTGGDLRYQSSNTYETFSVIPYAWHLQRGEGLGGVYISFLWNNIIASMPVSLLGGSVGIPWHWLEKIIFFYPFLLLSFFSSLFLTRRLLGNSPFAFFAPLIFILNTYILMLVSGGQMQIALAYSLIPFILGKYIDAAQSIKEKKIFTLRSLLILGLLLSLQVAMDTRVVYITLIAVGIYLLFSLRQVSRTIKNYILLFGIPFVVVLLLHAFWLIPLLLYGQSPIDQLGVAYSSTDAVKFFSFAKLENSISLLHPNWPENLFGKTYFMRAEFLILPLLAFVSLLFLPHKNQEKKLVLYFVLLALIGSFLAKGANAPFGELYIWSFEHIPGFSLFRDPTKWYILVAVSYTVLIPFSIAAVFNWLQYKQKCSFYKFTLVLNPKRFHLDLLFLFIFFYFFIYILYPAFSGKIHGTLQPTTLPKDYEKLETLLVSQTDFSRTFWVPTVHRFSFHSLQHPEMSGQGTFTVSSASAVLSRLEQKNAQTFLSEAAVRYVIVPYDPIGEIFANDHTYDPKQFEQTVLRTASVAGLTRIAGFEKMAVFETKERKDHFWTLSDTLTITHTFVNPTEYNVKLNQAKKGDRLIFSESFDTYWYAETEEGQVIRSERYHEKFNSFVLTKDGNYSLLVKYKPQQWVHMGGIISVLSLLIISFILFYRRKQ